MPRALAHDGAPGAAATARWRRWHPKGRLCAVCRCPAQGFGWVEPIRGMRRPRPPAWFCSKACQDFWTHRARTEIGMVDLTPEETAAIRAAIKPLAEVLDEIGWNTRLGDLTEAQVMTVIEVAVGGFQDALREIVHTRAGEVA
jgi:hypothetical protein